MLFLQRASNTSFTLTWLLLQPVEIQPLTPQFCQLLLRVQELPEKLTLLL